MAEQKNIFISEQKCEHCGEWTDGTEEYCQHCTKRLNEERLKKEKIRHENTKFDIILIKIHPTDHPVIVFFKKIIQYIQIVYFAILTFILWLISMGPG